MKCERKLHPYLGRCSSTCYREAKFVDIHGNNLCEYHYNKWKKKLSKKAGEK